MTPLRLTKPDSTPESSARSSRPPRQDAIGVWLAALVAVMRMPEREKNEIREELESHLRERVRDLLIEGVEEDEAASRALAELGEAAPLADRFRHARNTPRRRLIMNIAAVGLAGAALVTSVVALNAEPGKQGSVTPRGDHVITFEPAPENPTNGLLRLKIALDMGDGGSTITELVDTMAKTANLKPRIHWQSLSGEAGIDREFHVHMDSIDTDLAGGLRALFDAIGREQPGGYNLEYRVNGDVLEIATRNHFDSREAKLVRYDVQNILDSGVEKDEIRELIQTFVEPESWRDNGGDKASIRIVGGKLFVKAPPRMIEGVEFFVRQLSDKEEKKTSKAREEALTTLLAQVLANRSNHASVEEVLDNQPQGGDRSPLLLELIRRAQHEASGNAAPAAQPEATPPGGKDPRSQGPAQTDTRTFHLRYAEAGAARDLLHSAFNATPALNECAVERKFGVVSEQNAVIFQATSGQSDLAAKIIALIDAPAPAKLPAAEEAVEQYILSNVAAETMRDLLTEAFNVSPALKECAVGRSVIVDPRLNAVVVVATADQQKTVDRLIKLVDIGERLAAR